VEPITILVIAGLLAGAVSVLTGVRWLPTNQVYLSAFSKRPLTGRVARRVSWACIGVGFAVLAGVYLLVESL
jgi:hypothetical protein